MSNAEIALNVTRTAGEIVLYLPLILKMKRSVEFLLETEIPPEQGLLEVARHKLACSLA